jgi:uncharacterized membrane protein
MHIVKKRYSNQFQNTFSESEAHSTIESPGANPPKLSKAYTSIVIGWILRGGVILSAAFILIGMFLLILHPGALTGYTLGAFPHTLDQVWLGLLALRPQAVIALGLLLLIAIPVITVLASAVAFALEHDRRYVVIAITVLAILIVSLLIGRGGG